MFVGVQVPLRVPSCENICLPVGRQGSVGRARSAGWRIGGRGFESRFPLKGEKKDVKFIPIEIGSPVSRSKFRRLLIGQPFLVNRSR